LTVPPSATASLETGRTIRLWAERAGAGPPVVFVHGLGDDHGLWRKVVPQLSDQYETVAVDMPGHGRSDPIPEGATIEWFADEVAALIRGLDLERPVLVGLSMGGGIAQYVAIGNLGLLRGLVLVSTSPVFPEATRQRFLDRATLAEREGMLDAVVDPSVVRWFTPEYMAANPDEVAATRATVVATDPVCFARASRANIDRDCTARLGEIECPVLFVAGLEDPADPLRSEPLYRAGIRDVTIELLPDASHLVPVEAVDRFVPLLERFLARLDSPAG
jgi:pimeloyl-ACP methyl ester carboxylesterase